MMSAAGLRSFQDTDPIRRCQPHSLRHNDGFLANESTAPILTPLPARNSNDSRASLRFQFLLNFRLLVRSTAAADR